MLRLLLSLIYPATKLVLAYLLLASLVPTLGQCRGGGAVEKGVGSLVDARLQALEAKGFNGAVVVASGDRLLLLKGYGTANRSTQTRVNHQTLLHLGSVSKQFTGAAILRLEMDGKLKVSDPITKFLTGVPDDKKNITIHQLLTHTAGLPRGDDCSSEFAKLTRAEFVTRVLGFTLLSSPGDTHRYSNAGYDLLAAVVEIVSGKPFDRYLRDHLFRPAGMKNTGYNFSPEQLLHSARAYRGDRELMGALNPTIRNETGPAWCLRGSGGIISSAEDMYRWHKALKQNRILSAAAKQKLFFPHVAEEPGGSSFYGYGWAIFTTRRKTKLIAHDGGLSGYFTADMRMYADENVTIFVAAAGEEYRAQSAAAAIENIVFPPNGTASK